MRSKLTVSEETKTSRFYKTGMVKVQVEYDGDGKLLAVYIQAGSGLRTWCKLTSSEAREIRHILISEGQAWPHSTAQPDGDAVAQRMAIWIRAAASHEHASHAALHRDDPIDECRASYCVSARAALKGEEIFWPSGVDTPTT